MKNCRKPVSVKRVSIAVPDLVKGILVAAFLAYFFYRSIRALLPMFIPAGIYVAWECRKKRDKMNRTLIKQFSECILSVGSSIKSGYAAENAFLESMKDMEMMFGKDAEILAELLHIKGGLMNNLTLETLLREMGERTGLEEMKDFAELFAITKRYGGNLAEVISLTAESIRSRMIQDEEIYTILASQRLEQKIMNIVPFALILYLEVSSPGYFDMYYLDFTGRVIMTLFLLWYMGAYGLSEYILRKVGI